MLVEADVNGFRCRMQLDTGANGAIVWHQYKPSAVGAVEVSVSFAGITKQASASPETVDSLSHCKPGDAVGTLGNAFFEHGSLSIDLKASTLTFVARPTLADRRDAQPMLYARWGETGGHTLVEMKVGDAEPGYALLDTGSAAMDFGVLSEEQWAKAKASLPVDGGVRSFRIHAWGRDHDCQAAPAGAVLRAGKWQLAQATITFCPTLGFNPPMKLEGVLGMHAFRDSIITLDYPSQRWLVEKAH